MTDRIRELFPGCPPEEAKTIAAHTAARGSGRVGRTAAGRGLDEFAVTAAVRHLRTGYDDLLASSLDRASARESVAGEVHSVLAAWRRPS